MPVGRSLAGRSSSPLARSAVTSWARPGRGSDAFGVTAEELIGKTVMALPFLSQAERLYADAGYRDFVGTCRDFQ